MKLVVNGKECIIRERHLGSALRELSLDATYAAVAVNWKCVPKNEWESLQLEEDDRVEILVPQAGG